MKNTIGTDLLISAHMNPEEMISQEIIWENHQIEEGVRKYNELMDQRSLEDTTGGMKLLKSVIHNTIAGMKEAYVGIDEQINGKVGSKTQSWLYMLPLVTPEQASIISVNLILAYCENPKLSDAGYTTLCRKLADALNAQVKFENWKKNSKEENEGSLDKQGNQYKKSPAQMLIEKNKGSINKRKLSRWEAKFDNYTEIQWTDVEKMNIGSKMLDVVCKASPEIFLFDQRTKMGKTVRTVTMSESAWTTYANTEGFAELQRPFLLPTLIKPVPYSYKDGKVTGGYHHIDTPFFSRGLHAHTSSDPTATSQSLLDSVNKIQDTAWQINPFILAVLEMVYGTGAEVEGVSYVCNKTMPERITTEAFNALSKEDKVSFKEKITQVQTEIASERGKHSSFTRKIMIANKLKNHERFFFPHFADFRGRLYPLPQELTPQGDKVAKSLLQFADGKKLGTTGLKWLCIHAANTFGMDKESLENREKWSLDNIKMMTEVSSNPLTNKDWTKAEEPFPFLAVAKELSEAMELADPADYVSRIPCAMDGTVNGMQILSLMGRDVKGAVATNCTSSTERQDLYTEVAQSVITLLAVQAKDCAISAEWFELLKNNPSKARKVVKQPVMTTPYGVTKKGMEDQLIANKHCNGFVSGNRTDVAKVIAEVILTAMTKVNGKAVEIMEYLQGVAMVLCEQNLPFQWMTPNGLKVTQAYVHHAEKRVQTVLGDIRLEIEQKELGLIGMRTANGSSPNVIHSFDAAMLQMTVLKMAEAGHEDFAMIHDSYGVHACSTQDLHVALREVALEIFGGNCLEDLHAFVATQTDAELPTMPTLGEYDINEIISAPYFFS